jgi:hypothetical protein
MTFARETSSWTSEFTRRELINRQLKCRCGCADRCPLLGNSGQRWVLACDGLSANDPKRTSGQLSNRRSVVCKFSLAARSQSARLWSLQKAWSSRGSHATARVHHTYRRCGGRVAACRGRAAARPRAAHRRADRFGRRRSRVSGALRSIPARAAAVGLDRRPQRADRLPLCWGRCRH